MLRQSRLGRFDGGRNLGQAELVHQYAVLVGDAIRTRFLVRCFRRFHHIVQLASSSRAISSPSASSSACSSSSSSSGMPYVRPIASCTSSACSSMSAMSSCMSSISSMLIFLNSFFIDFMPSFMALTVACVSFSVWCAKLACSMLNDWFRKFSTWLSYCLRCFSTRIAFCLTAFLAGPSRILAIWSLYLRSSLSNVLIFPSIASARASTWMGVPADKL
uniref:Uncharacterized protein n=1 Tax=Anopheles melas TaxID=34690 RepID=A0A182U252_9DIPT